MKGLLICCMLLTGWLTQAQNVYTDKPTDCVEENRDDQTGKWKDHQVVRYIYDENGRISHKISLTTYTGDTIMHLIYKYSKNGRHMEIVTRTGEMRSDVYTRSKEVQEWDEQGLPVLVYFYDKEDTGWVLKQGSERYETTYNSSDHISGFQKFRYNGFKWDSSTQLKFQYKGQSDTLRSVIKKSLLFGQSSMDSITFQFNIPNAQLVVKQWHYKDDLNKWDLLSITKENYQNLDVDKLYLDVLKSVCFRCKPYNHSQPKAVFEHEDKELLNDTTNLIIKSEATYLTPGALSPTIQTLTLNDNGGYMRVVSRGSDQEDTSSLTFLEVHPDGRPADYEYRYYSSKIQIFKVTRYSYSPNEQLISKISTTTHVDTAFGTNYANRKTCYTNDRVIDGRDNVPLSADNTIQLYTGQTLQHVVIQFPWLGKVYSMDIIDDKGQVVNSSEVIGPIMVLNMINLNTGKYRLRTTQDAVHTEIGQLIVE